MLLAKTRSCNSFEVYISLIDNISHNETAIYKVFSDILDQSKQLIDNRISYYQIDPKIYTIVSYLASDNSDYIRAIKIDRLSNTDLTDLRSILEKGNNVYA